MIPPDSAASTGTWSSKFVVRGSDGKYDFPVIDNHRIPNFGVAGYDGGRSDLPDTSNLPAAQIIEVPLSPDDRDDTPAIQAALDRAASLVKDDKMRVRVQLLQGEYKVKGTLQLNADRVVLAGKGPELTTLRRPKTAVDNDASVIEIGGDSPKIDMPTDDDPSARNITTDLVREGSFQFQIALKPGDNTTPPFKKGDAIIVCHPATSAWFDDVDPNGKVGWENDPKNSFYIRYRRYIKAFSGNTVTLDAPVFNRLHQATSQCYICKFETDQIRREIGVQSFRITIETNGETQPDPTHCRSAIVMKNAENCWIRNVTASRFSFAGINLGPNVTRSTVLNCRAENPHSPVEPKFRYNFCTSGAQLVLFENCYASEGRHSFAANGSTRDSGIVFLDCTIDQPLAVAEPHQRWAQGVLYDHVVVKNRNGRTDFMFGLSNRGDEGSGHGWSAANCVLWRCNPDGGTSLVQNPPTAQNYAIGCMGAVVGTWQHPGSIGAVEGTGKGDLRPESLYRTQRDDLAR